MSRSFGIEEEFMLLDGATLCAVDEAAGAIEALREASSGQVTAEFLPSQIEHASVVHTDADDALSDLLTFRRALDDWARPLGVVPMASGTPPHLPSSAPVILGDRYRRIARDVGVLAQEHQINGTHVHVGVDDPDDRVRVSNGFREWLPFLVSLTANSPFWAGQDTGHESWRVIQSRRWTTNGIPPSFADHDEHERVHERLTGVGATRRASEASWGVRLSTRFPTVELRICDTQLHAREAVGIAELSVAITEFCLTTQPAATPHHVLDAELWHAARFGSAAGVFDPIRGEHRAWSDVAAGVLRVLQPAPHAVALVQTATAGMSGAAAQRRAQAHGGLGALYASTFAAGG